MGVASGDLETAAEFFELFKIAWEPVRPRTRYAAVIGDGVDVSDLDAGLLVLYGSDELPIDRRTGTAVARSTESARIQWRQTTLPIYGASVSFSQPPGALTSGGTSLDYRTAVAGRPVWRIGYDLFAEVKRLLTEGQPASHAHVPSLDLHIALLRSVLIESGVPFVEVPPRPAGHSFVCCLTHDVDFCGIRRHRADATLAGFIGRASIGTLADLLRGRRSLGQAGRNWRALASLPFVFLGLLRDFWSPFEDYAQADGSRPSTFFVVPFKARPGVAPDGGVAKRRAVKYQASEVRDELRRTVAADREVAVHGLDAWRDATAGREECEAIGQASGAVPTGVRMHWLYWSAESPAVLEAAGFSYDSTCGYNEAVGYRAGTAQPFRLPGTATLLELPLTIMDSALFYRGRMNMAPGEAAQQCRAIVDHAREHGGTVVINWHDRSLVPERLWDSFYRDLLADLDTGGDAWYATSAQAVQWFRWRRSIRFVPDSTSGRMTVEALSRPAGLPPAVAHVHRPDGAAGRQTTIDEFSIEGLEPTSVSL